MATGADWRGSKSAAGCLEALCLQEKMSDVIFKFPDSDEQLHAHKFVLSMRSAVFEAMFNGPMADTQKEILIGDSDPQTFKLFLRYLYADKTYLQGSSVMKCLHLGRKYLVEAFVNACASFLEERFAIHNVFIIYEEAVRFDMSDLQERCMRFMADHAEDVFQCEEFMAVSNKMLCTFLARNDLVVYAETSVFAAALNWAKRRIQESGDEETGDNIRRHLGDAFKCVRFPLIPSEYLATTVRPSQLLSDEEELQLYRYIASGNIQGSTANIGIFQTEERKPRSVDVFLDYPDSEYANNDIDSDSVRIWISGPSNLKLKAITGTLISHQMIRSLQANGIKLPKRSFTIADNKLVFSEDIALDQNSTNIVLQLKKAYKCCSEVQDGDICIIPDSEVEIRNNMGTKGGISYLTFTK